MFSIEMMRINNMIGKIKGPVIQTLTNQKHGLK